MNHAAGIVLINRVRMGEKASCAVVDTQPTMPSMKGGGTREKF